MSTESARKAALAAAEYFRPSGVPKEYADNAVKVHADRLEPIMEHVLAAACQTVAPPPEELWLESLDQWEIGEDVFGDGVTSRDCGIVGDVIKAIIERLPKSGVAPAVDTAPSCSVCHSPLTMDGNPPTPSGCSNEHCPSATYPAAVSTPRCPVCLSEKLSLAFSFQELRVSCANNHTTGVHLASDMRQFFQPAPSPPEMCNCPYAADQSHEWHPLGSDGCRSERNRGANKNG